MKKIKQLPRQSKRAFTAVEVMIALVIASVFLIAGFQLYGIVAQGHLYSRMRSEASSIAYAHLRDRTNRVTMADCSTSVKVIDEKPFDGENMTDLKITSRISAPYRCSEKVLKVEVIVEYTVNGSKQTERQALYVDKT